MRGALLVWGGRALGVGLIVLVLSVVGWRDSVRDAAGKEWTGRIVVRGGDAVLLERAGERLLVSVAPGTAEESVRIGLRTTLGRLWNDPRSLLIGVVLHLTSILWTAIRWAVLLHGAGLTTATPRVLRLSWIGFFSSTLLPGIVSGDIVKAVYAAHHHPERRVRAVLSIVADRVIGLFVMLVIVSVVLFIVPADLLSSGARLSLLVVAVGVTGGLGAVLWVAAARSLRPEDRGAEGEVSRIRALIEEAGRAVAQYARRPGVLGAACVLTLLGHITFLAALWSYARALGTDLSLVAIGVAVPAAQLVSAVPLLPGGWGLGESAFYVFLGRAGVVAGTAVALSLSYRVVQALLALPGGLMLVGLRRREDEAAPQPATS